MRATPNPSRRRAPVGVALALLLACSPATKLPASEAAPVAEPAQPVVAPAPAPATPPAVAPVATAPATAPAVAPVGTAPAAARECRNGERLDSGCECRSGGACFDICCGPNAGCAHPADPGGPSACMLRMDEPPPAAPVKVEKPCTDGQFLSDGCKCTGKTCMDICCVGSTCTHHASEAGGYAKCMSRR
jgi:hypothetical protein